ncbi:MAG TPA: creatininase family protein [Actinopolymorphaceae bacterium]
MNLHGPIPAERYLPYLTSSDIAQLPKTHAAVILPVASIEQHGPHLPVASDTLIGQVLLARALERAPQDAHLWVLPPLVYGKSNEHRAFPGTFTLSATTLSAVIHEIADGVARSGFRRLVLLNSHGGNPGVLSHVARDVREATGLMVFPLTVFLMGLPDEEYDEEEAAWGTHAGEWETSLLLHLAPELVRTDRIESLGQLPKMPEGVEHLSLRGPVTFAWLSQDISTTGVMGDPRKSTPERGERTADMIVEKLTAVLCEMARFEMPQPAGGDPS